MNDSGSSLGLGLYVGVFFAFAFLLLPAYYAGLRPKVGRALFTLGVLGLAPIYFVGWVILTPVGWLIHRALRRDPDTYVALQTPTGWIIQQVRR